MDKVINLTEFKTKNYERLKNKPENIDDWTGLKLTIEQSENKHFLEFLDKNDTDYDLLLNFSQVDFLRQRIAESFISFYADKLSSKKRNTLKVYLK